MRELRTLRLNALSKKFYGTLGVADLLFGVNLFEATRELVATFSERLLETSDFRISLLTESFEIFFHGGIV